LSGILIEGGKLQSGIIIVDKPKNWTSHDVIAKLRGALRKKRIGHGGTLDPMATGVLPVFIGRATRAVEFCENAEKEYIAGLKLGVVTDTQDITGSILSECGFSATVRELTAVLPRFMGAQKQIPPMYSAIKQGGKKLYELARRGIEVPRPARDVTISALEITGSSAPGEYTLRIVCSKGTYIRTLCHDIGAALGCGGTLSSLRRIRAGAFTIEASHTLDALLAAFLTDSDSDAAGQQFPLILPVDSVFSEFSSISLGEADTRKVKNGASCHMRSTEDGIYRFYAPDGEFLLLGEVKNNEMKTIKSFFEIGSK
jgi:tRNA pseudouridine55 synthase